MSFQNRKLLNSPYIPLGLSNLKSVPVFSEGSTSKLTQHFQSQPLNHIQMEQIIWRERVMQLEMENQQLKQYSQNQQQQIERLRQQNESLKNKVINSTCQVGAPNFDFPQQQNIPRKINQSQTRKLIGSINQDIEQVLMSYMVEHPHLMEQILDSQDIKENNFPGSFAKSFLERFKSKIQSQ